MRPESRNEPDRVDPLDALLASRPVRPSTGFADGVFARIARESGDASEPTLDALLASHPVRVSGDLPDRVLAQVAAERRRRFRLFRLLPAAAGVAACVALVMIPMSGRSASALGERVAAAINGDAELQSLVALPAAKASSLNTDDLAVLADLGAAFAVELPDYVYEI